jgi:hypothetical protein
MSNERMELLRLEAAALKQEISDIDKTIADKDKTIADKDKTIADEDKTIAERSLRVLKTKAFVFVDRTDSEPHCASKTHSKSKLIETNIELKEFPDKVWDAAYMTPTKQKEFSVDSETMIVEQAVHILQALIDGLGLGELVYVSTNTIVAGVELGIVLLFGSQRIPFGVIEVKKSGKEGFDHKHIFQGEDSPVAASTKAGVTTGQHLDQLNAIGLFGFKSVFGMITNGNKWMITSTTAFSEEDPGRDWNLDSVLRTREPAPNDTLPEQNLLFLAESPMVRIPISAAAAVSEEECSRKTEDSMEESSVKSELDDTSEDDRVLYASQVVDIKEIAGAVSGKSVVQLIAEFLRLACESFSTITPKTIGNSMASCRVLDINASRRCSFKKKMFSKGAQPGKYLLDTCKIIYLVASIGRG